MKETLHSFYDTKIHFRDIAKAKSVYERKKHFYIALVLALFVVYNLLYRLTG